jgi:RsiW-degrading membrane proteinase PrsW (M82 family)
LFLTYLFYIILGFLPSTIWLLFYLRKDLHPEPKNQILKTFAWGMMIAPLAAILEFALVWIMHPAFNTSQLATLLDQTSAGWRGIISVALFAPAVEEYLKYKITKEKISKDSDFDEPLDMMIYLIIGALGFAAIENLIVLLKDPLMTISQALGTISIRFVSATFLHALASGIVGYFLAKSFIKGTKGFPLIIQGLLIAIICHGAYNYLIVSSEKFPAAIFLIAALLAAMGLFVSISFSKLKKQLSVCKIT